MCPKNNTALQAGTPEIRKLCLFLFSWLLLLSQNQALPAMGCALGTGSGHSGAAGGALGIPFLTVAEGRGKALISSKAMENWVRETQPAFPLPLLSAQKQKGFSSLHFHFIRFPFLITRRQQWILWLLLMDAVEMDQCAEPALDSVPLLCVVKEVGTSFSAIPLEVFSCLRSKGGVGMGKSRDGHPEGSFPCYSTCLTKLCFLSGAFPTRPRCHDWS